jgi:hypothetical protein
VVHAAAVGGGHTAEPGCGSGNPPSWNCDRWARELADYFFPASASGTPVLLAVDDDTLSIIRGVPGEEAAGDLVAAVRPHVRPKDNDPFKHFYEQALDWRVAGAAAVPPFLPLLAVCVLAVTRMAASDGIASHNYYLRLRELLGFPLTREPVPKYDTTLPDMWHWLAEWLDTTNHGMRGRSAIDHNPDLRYIFPAFSQASLRRSDRQRLGAFFRYLGLAPGDTIDPSELFAYFQVWTTHAPMSAGARRAAVDPRTAEHLSRILESELAAWDGHERDSGGRVLGSLALTLSLRHPLRLEMLAERVPGGPERLTVRWPDGVTDELKAVSPNWYVPLARRLREDNLVNGVHLESDGLAFTFRAGRCFIFTADDELGQLVSVRTAAPFQRYSALVAPDLRDRARAMLRDMATPGWRELRADDIVPGWYLYTGIEVISDVLPDAPLPALTPLLPRAATRISLQGGLPLPRGTDVYLSGGEPDVWLPEGTDAQVTVDAQPVQSTSGARYPLFPLGLAEGGHEIRVGPARRAFRTLRATGRIRPEPLVRVVTRIARHGSRYHPQPTAPAAAHEQPPAGEIWVEGVRLLADSADVPPPHAQPLRIRTGADPCIIIGAHPGQVLQVRPLPPPAWASRAGLLWNFEDIRCDFEAVWILQKWTQWRVELVSARQPGPAATADPERIAEWRNAFTLPCLPDADDTAAMDLWNAYLDAADEL